MEMFFFLQLGAEALFLLHLLLHLLGQLVGVPCGAPEDGDAAPAVAVVVDNL